MDRLQQVDWRGLVKTATQKVKKYTLNLTDLELQVEDATSSETWGPHGGAMNEIADAAFDPEGYRQIMGVLARRLQEKDENWRMCYKALLLLEHLLKHGPAKIVGDVQSSASVLERLAEGFDYKDANQRDHGVNVRHRAKEILSLVGDPDRLREERDKAKANRAKYRGVSADQMRSGSGASSASSSFNRGDSSSFGRSGGAANSALFPSTAAPSPGGGGGLGSSRRTSSYDETEEGAHYISKRPSGVGSSAAPGAAGGVEGDAVAATRARIDKLRLGGAGVADEAKLAEESKKRLTDVRVNPKIAASLGLRAPAPPAAAAPSSAAVPPSVAAYTAPAGEVDLLGGLMDDPPAPAAAPPPPPAAAAFDPLAAAAPAAPQQQQPWGSPTFAAPGGSPGGGGGGRGGGSLDLLGSMGSGSGLPAFPQQQVQQQRPPAPLADPFAPARPAAAAAPAPLPSVLAGVPAALPEDMFSELTGISRPQQPMMPGSGAPQYPQQQYQQQYQQQAAHPSSAFAGYQGGGGGGAGFTPPAMAATGSYGATPPQLQQQVAPPPLAGHARTSSVGRSADFGSLSYNAAQQGGASGADPFADLLK